MFYPSLFESQELEDRGDLDVSGIPFTELRDKVLKTGKKVTIKVDDSDYLWEVDGKDGDDPITWDYLWDLGKSLGYTKELFKFLKEKIDLDVKKEIDAAKKIRKRKRDGNPDFMPEDDIPFTFGEFWAHQIDTYEEKESSGEKTPKEKVIEIDIEEDFPAVDQYFRDASKMAEIDMFIENIPQSGGALVELKDLLRIFEAILKEEQNIQIHKGASNVHLPKDQYSKWKEDMVEYIGKYSSPDELNDIYKDQILKKGTFLNYLFQLEPKGVGRGEFMLCYLISGAKLSGGSEDYDIEVIGDAIYEVKDYSKAGTSEEDAIRLGTHGKLSQFEFFQEIKNLVSGAKKIWDNVGEKNLRKIVGKYNFQYWKWMTSDANYNNVYKAIPSAVNAGELPPKRLKVIIDWCFLNHLLIEGESGAGEEYTMAILRGDNMQPRTVKIDPVKDGEIAGGKKVTISELEDQEKMFNELRSLKYIRDPHQLIEDLQNSPHDYFSKVLEKMNENDMEFFFLIFRTNEIKVLKDTDFNLATITQSSIKITEGSKKTLSAIQDAFKDFKKLQGENPSEEAFWDYYRKYSKTTNESHYPRLANY